MGTQGFNHRNMLGAWKKVDNAELVEVEFRQAKQKIEEEVKSPVEFFAWPYWQTPKEGIAPGLEVYKLLRSGVFLEEEYYRRYGPDPMMPGEPGKLLSFAPIAPEDPKAWERISDWVKQREGWLILCFHGITPSNTNGQQVSGWEPIGEGRFRNILKTLIAEEDIWVAPMGEVFRHIQDSRN